MYLKVFFKVHPTLITHLCVQQEADVPFSLDFFMILIIYVHTYFHTKILATFSLNFVQVGKGRDLKTIFIFNARYLKNGKRDFSGSKYIL